MATRRSIPILLAALLAPAAWGQQAEPPKKPAEPKVQAEQEAKPAVVSSPALQLGAKMQEAASAELLKWAREYAKREVLGRPTASENEAIAKAIATRYSKAPLPAREAGLFFLWYVAYQQAGQGQLFAGARVRDLDRDVRSLEDDLLRIRNTPVPIAQAAAARDAEARAEQRLEDVIRQRTLHQRQLDAARARVDNCLERLAALHEQWKDRDPAEIRALK